MGEHVPGLYRVALFDLQVAKMPLNFGKHLDAGIGANISGS
jgi:hypothetical protein